MLVLTRESGESIIIDVAGEMIEVIVAGINKNKVRIGVIASKSVQVNRPEIRAKKLKSAEKDGEK